MHVLSISDYSNHETFARKNKHNTSKSQSDTQLLQYTATVHSEFSPILSQNLHILRTHHLILNHF